MKQMKFTIYAIATLLLMGCAQMEESAEPKGSGAQSADVVGFDVYTQRATRSGTADDVTTDNLKTGAHSADGFGVFAYYTGEDNYSLDFTPNFMYNQQVKYNSSAQKFAYEPVKYWPNEENHHVSFFAYAPWVDVTATTGAAADQTYGITGMTKNNATGAPLIHYVATTDLSKGVDLCWDQQLNKLKPNNDSKVEFTLKHALSKLNVKVQTSVDVNASTKIYIRSITFSGFTMKGSLNLNSATAQWTAYEKGGLLNKDAVTFYDGRRDGREGYVADDSELPAGLNPDLVQSTLWDNFSPKPGVTNSAQNLFSGATADDPAYVIPTGDPVDITIEYDIETADPKLKGYFLSDGKTNGTSIANRITKTNVLDHLDAGKSYAINLNLGLTDVTFDATEVRNWKTYNPGALSGIFSVSSTKRVYFSQGNLQYQASTSTWRFAPNQYDMIGSDNTNISNSYTGWIDLLGWGTGNNPTNSSTNNGDYSTFTDWGVNAISNGSNTANLWCTLTKDEWGYLLEHHTKGWSIVNGVNGYVIRPDGVSTAVATSYTAADWAVEEEAGSVFLPAGGSRGGTTFNTGFGDYWSSTSTNSNNAYYLYFHSGGQNPAASAGRFGGRSVRLVYEVPYFLGAGTEANPYLISSETDWNYLATKVNSGTNYAGKFFRQTANINVTTMVGNSSASRPFSGTYDGYGKTLNLNLNTAESHTAPFRFIANATIKNVVTTGTVHSTDNHPSGLVGATDGTCTIQNCRVGANVGGAQHSGGIVGHSMSANISIIGCVYSGTLTPASGQWTGGIIGWGGDGGGHTISISDCLFAGTLTGSTKFHPIGILQNQSNTKYLSNTYYTLGAQNTNDDASFVNGLAYKGKFARSIAGGTDVTVARSGATTVYDVSGITSYGTGILYGGVLYAGNGEAVSLTLSHTDKSGFSFSQYTVTGGGSLNNPTSNSPTLTMTDANQTINALFVPQGAISGKFSVSSTKQVYFSQGNLQATTSNKGSTWTWAFAAHQWDYIGNAVANNSVNGNGTVATNGTVDLFGWSTAATTFGILNSTSSSNYSGDFVDWGSNIGTGWRTLTKDEWVYLFITRTSNSSVNGTSDARYAHATINTDGTSVNGLILFPDGVTIASNEATSWGNINATSSWTGATKCTSAQWTALAAKGCVFLPAAGLWFASVSYTGTNGDYWSSSLYDANYAYCVDFLSTYLYHEYWRTRSYRCSVRLVRDAN